MQSFSEESVKQLKILVIGDVMLDRYIDGVVSRVSPEDPTCLVLEQVNQNYQLGGAANVARNLASLAASVVLLGFGGSKNQVEKFRSVLHNTKRVASRVLYSFADVGRRLTVKTRYRANGKQLLRVDYEDSEPPTKVEAESLLRVVVEVLEGDCFDCAILSDYNKGVLADTVLPELIKLLGTKQVPYIVDPKRPDLSAYGEPLVICPNELEWQKTCDSGGRSLAKHIVVTRGKRGCTLLAPRHGTQQPGLSTDFLVEPVEICDPTGAGDTFVAALTVAMCCGRSIEQACHIANCSARLSVMSPGAYAPTFTQVMGEL